MMPAGVERRLTGIPAAEGVAEGLVHLLPSALEIKAGVVAAEHIAAELARLDRAIDTTDARFRALASDLEVHGKRSALELVMAYRLMLRSPEIAGEARRRITEQSDEAEWAVRQATDDTVSTFDAMEDAYQRERGRDAYAVGEQLLRALLGLPDLRVGQGVVARGIAVAFEFSPLEVARLEARGAIGLISESGGRSSHAAILARSLGLPFVAGVVGACAQLAAEEHVVIDGRRGIVVANPEAATVAELRARATGPMANAGVPRAQDGSPLPLATYDGVAISLQANIERPAQIQRAIALGAEGVGLFRTEFLYLDRVDLPSEEEQLADACSALAALEGRPATFRTLDLAADKLPLAVPLPEGHNPALGVRSIRFSLRRPDIFRTQLRALYRAGVHGPMRIMLPLVSGTTELRAALQIAAGVREELARDGVEHAPEVPLGVMVETPSAALTTDHLGRDCAFLSLGTNDLMQYAFAADRDNVDVAALYHPLHPAHLRLIQAAVAGAASAGRPLSICGDMAGDPGCAQILLGLGLRAFSMTPTALPGVAAVVRATRLADAIALATRALSLSDENEVEALAESALLAGETVPAADSLS
jgi:phosphoenolpyruvate-protein phosphotransferase (PTS system enzyme I)